MTLTFDQIVGRKKGNSLSHAVLKTLLFQYVCRDSVELSRNDSIIVEMQRFRNVSSSCF